MEWRLDSFWSCWTDAEHCGLSPDWWEVFSMFVESTWLIRGTVDWLSKGGSKQQAGLGRIHRGLSAREGKKQQAGLGSKEEMQPYTERWGDLQHSGGDHWRKVGGWIQGWKVDFLFLFLEKIMSLGREPSTNCTILDTYFACIGKGLLGTGFRINLWFRVGLWGSIFD